MNNFFTSLIRTYVPIGVGAVVSWLTVRGVAVDPQDAASLAVALTGIVSAGYYLVVRLFEKKFPQVGWLLGQAKVVKYTDSPK